MLNAFSLSASSDKGTLLVMNTVLKKFKNFDLHPSTYRPNLLGKGTICHQFIQSYKKNRSNCNYSETIVRTFIVLSRQSQFNQKTMLDNAQ